MDADSGRQLWAHGLLIEVRDSVENREAGAGAALSVVVVGFGITEEGHHAVAEVLSNVAAEAGYRLTRCAL
jgi:hypothetical protein